jgi:guanine nucleotide-binding protein subunit alpha
MTPGSGESGKSTITKQMKMIYMNGYSTEELLTYRSNIYRNVIESIKQILIAMERINAEISNEQTKARKC